MVVSKITRAFIIAAVALFMCGCGSGYSDDPSMAAAEAARHYYDCLSKGQYAEYVSGLYKPDSIPDSYRSQLELNAEMFMEQQQKEHGGIKKVRIYNCKADTARRIANAFLTIDYGNGSSEEVVVPMVKAGSRWLMK